MRLVLAFDEEFDFKSDDIVIQGHKLNLPSNLEVIDVNSAVVQEEAISSTYEAYVESIKPELNPHQYSVLFGSNNNLYTNHLSLHKWIATIETVLKSKNIEEIVITDLVKGNNYAPYYEAEGEAHTRLLYKPYDFIPGVIFDYLSQKPDISNILTVHGIRSKTLRLARIFIRRDVLLLVKALFFLLQLLKYRFKGTKVLKYQGTASELFFTRSIAHFDGVANLHKFLKGSAVFCGEGGFTFGKNVGYTQQNTARLDYFLNYLTVLDIFKAIFKIYILRMSSNLRRVIRVGGVKYSYSSAASEMFIAYFEVELFKISCVRFCDSIVKSGGNPILYCCEMYTPYALAVAEVGQEFNLTTVQVQTTNMFVIYEPNYVFCDYFVFTSKTLRDSYIEKYPDAEDKVLFLGNFYEPISQETIDLSNLSQPNKVVYFTQPLTDEDIEQDIIESLCRLAEKVGYKLMIKLHPRDPVEKVTNFKGRCEIVGPTQEFEQYMKGVDLAVLKTSSIAAKIVLSGTPIIYCLYSEWARNGFLDYIDMSYAGTTTQIDQIETCISDFDATVKSFNEYRNKYITDNGLDLGIEYFIEQSQKLFK